jgi:hypothetical protein
MSEDIVFKTGEEGYAHAQQLQAENKLRFSAQRFWLMPGKSAKVTFLDSVGIYFHEHELQVNGRWGNYFTCRKDFSECPLCDAGHRPTYVAAYSVIDHSEYTTKKGDVLKNQKKLLVLRPTVMNKLARRRADQKDGDLTYYMFSFARDKKEECRTGEDIQLVKRITPKALLSIKPKDANITDEEWLKPFDYRKLFAPRSVEELRRLIGQAPPVGSYEQSSNAFGESTDAVGEFLVEGSESAAEGSLDDLL